MVQDRKKRRKTSLAANMVTGLNVNILTRSLVQTAFLGQQKAVDHVLLTTKNNFQNSPKKTRLKKKAKYSPVSGLCHTLGLPPLKPLFIITTTAAAA
jgi:hypothetical protein